VNVTTVAVKQSN